MNPIPKLKPFLEQKQNLLQSVLIFLCFLSWLSIVYAPALYGQFAIQDDYALLTRDEDINHYWDISECKQRGRYLAAYVVKYSALWVRNVSELSRLRWITLFCYSFCSMITFVYLRKYLKSRGQSFFLTVAVYSLPPFNNMIAQGLGIVGALSLIPAALAGGFFAKFVSCKRWSTLFRLKSFWWAILLLVSSLMLYQPSAMYFWLVGILVVLAEAGHSMNSMRSQLSNLFTAGLTGIGAYGGIFQITRLFSSDGTRMFPGQDVYSFIFNFFEQIFGFASGAVYISLNLWNMFPRNSYAAVFVGIVLMTFLLYLIRNASAQPQDLRRLIQKPAAIALIWVSLSLLSFLPNLVALGYSPYYRSYLTLASLVLISLFLMIRYGVLTLKGNGGVRILTVFLCLVALWGSYNAFKSTYQYYVFPQQLELEYVKSHLDPNVIKRYEEILLVLPDSAGNLFNGRDSHLQPFTTFVHNKNAMVRCAFIENGAKTVWVGGGAKDLLKCKILVKGGFMTRHYSIFWQFPGDPYRIRPQRLVIDMNNLFSYLKQIKS